MTEEEKTLLKTWITNTQIRIDNDFQEARGDFYANENPWFAFRLAIAAERKNQFDIVACQLFALLHI